MVRFQVARTTSLVIALSGAVINIVLAAQMLGIWRAFKWEPESEWEGSEYSFTRDGVRIVWGLLSTYFAIAFVACAVGVVGIVRNLPSLVRFHRDFSIANFVFGTAMAAVGLYVVFRPPVRSAVCEQMLRQPDILVDMMDLGLNLENCEFWFSRAVMASTVVVAVLAIIRLRFIVALSHYYTQLLRVSELNLPSYTPLSTHCVDEPMERIYLLPRQSLTVSKEIQDSEIPIYAPVSLNHISAREVEELRANALEAWIPRSESPSPASSRSHSHTRSHSALQFQLSHTHKHRRHGSTGRITLPIQPGEGLLQAYNSLPLKA